MKFKVTWTPNEKPISKYNQGEQKDILGVKGLATKPDELSSIYKAHILEGKSCFLQGVFWPLCMPTQHK